MTACYYFVGKTCDGTPGDAHCTACLLFLTVASGEKHRRGLAPKTDVGPQAS